MLRSKNRFKLIPELEYPLAASSVDAITSDFFKISCCNSMMLPKGFAPGNPKSNDLILSINTLADIVFLSYRLSAPANW